jgi:hypothetical protein
VGFNLDSPRVSAHTKMRDWLLKTAPQPEQIRLLESILRQNIRKLSKSSDKKLESTTKKKPLT